MWCVIARTGVRLSPVQDPPYCDIRSSARPLVSAGYGDKFHTECKRHDLLYIKKILLSPETSISQPSSFKFQLWNFFSNLSFLSFTIRVT